MRSNHKETKSTYINKNEAPTVLPVILDANTCTGTVVFIRSSPGIGRIFFDPGTGTVDTP